MVVIIQELSDEVEHWELKMNEDSERMDQEDKTLEGVRGGGGGGGEEGGGERRREEEEEGVL